MSMKRVLCLILILAAAVMLSSCGDEIPNTVFSPGDLAGKRIGAVAGSEAPIRAHDIGFDGASVIEYTALDVAVVALKAGEVDCLFVDSEEADAAARGFGVAKLDESVPDAGYRFAVAKENVDLTEDINAALSQLRENGVLDSIIAGYTGESDYRYEISDREYSANIVMAVEVVGAPYCYYDGDTLRGLEVDVAHAVCDILGVGIEFKTVEHDELIIEAQKGRAMFSAGRLTEEEEGAQLVDFTDEYFVTSQKIIVRN